MSEYTSRFDYKEFLVDLFREHGFQQFVGAEVGVWGGDTSVSLLKAFPSLTLYMVDHWELGAGIDTSVLNMRKERLLKKHRLHAEKQTSFAEDRRTLVRNFSVKACEGFEDESLDFVFIDANHQYDYVKEDLVAWFPKVKPGGVFCGHDYGSKRERRGMWGVKKAVDEFALKLEYPVKDQAQIWWFVK